MVISIVCYGAIVGITIRSNHINTIDSPEFATGGHLLTNLRTRSQDTAYQIGYITHSLHKTLRKNFWAYQPSKRYAMNSTINRLIVAD